MKAHSYFLAVRTILPEEGIKTLQWGIDIFPRPMAWSLWLKAIFPMKSNPWRFVRVFGLQEPLSGYQVFLEEDEVSFDNEHHFKLERPILLLVLEWALESIYYGTSLKFWKWPICQAIKRYFTEF